MDTKTSSQTPTACRHLGQAGDPFQHSDAPSDEHRCYLWMQRDRIDHDHQKGFCLSGRFRNCPWLHISLPCQSAAQRVWQEAVVCTMSDTGRWVWPRLVIMMRALALLLIAWARAFGQWTGEKLPVALAWLRRELAPGCKASGGALLRTARQFIVRDPRPVKKRPASAPAKAAIPALVDDPIEDFDAMMRLGREASQAGRRNQAHLCFSKAADLNPASADAWLWMAATAENPEQSFSFLEKALAIDPESGRARSQLAEVKASPEPQPRKARAAARAGTAVSRLIEKGIAALDAGDEDDAYQCFAQATDTDRSNEAAWFWRAKTASDLDEVVKCLRRVLQLNPDNQQAHASLSWAMDRQRAIVHSSRPVPARDAQPVIPGLYSQTGPVGQPFLMQLASTAYMALGIIWIGPIILPLLDGSFTSLYKRTGILPLLQLPYLSSNSLVSEIPLPEFNLFYAVPLMLALLSFVAMEVIWSKRRIVSLYLAVVAIAGIVGIWVFGAGQAPSVPLSVLSAIIGVIALGGRISYHRRAKLRPARATSN